MATIAQVRTGMAGVLDNITGLRVYPRWPNTVNVPAAIVKRAGSPSRTTLSGNWRVNIEITIAVQLVDLDRAQAALDEYISPTGAKSIIAALESDETLGGNAEYILIGEWGEDEGLAINDVDYATAKLPVEVHFLA
ncbi:MAG: hypothetical protein Q7J84_03945 [Sulfuricaulis sp.]|nr:hypothetical protein [Sulfuricaulis sp.]